MKPDQMPREVPGVQVERPISDARGGGDPEETSKGDKREEKNIVLNRLIQTINGQEWNSYLPGPEKKPGKIVAKAIKSEYETEKDKTVAVQIYLQSLHDDEKAVLAVVNSEMLGYNGASNYDANSTQRVGDFFVTLSTKTSHDPDRKDFIFERLLQDIY